MDISQVNITGKVVHAKFNNNRKVDPSIIRLNNGTIIKSSIYWKVSIGDVIDIICERKFDGLYYLKANKQSIPNTIKFNVGTVSGLSSVDNRTDYGIQYGEFVNFSMNVIRKSLEDSRINMIAFDELIIKYLSKSQNINKDLYGLSDSVINGCANLLDIVNGTSMTIDILKRIALIWRYGLINKNPLDKVLAYFMTNWSESKGPLEIINELFRCNKEEAHAPIPKLNYHKYPFLFTGAQYQFYLLDITEKQMRSIKKMDDLDQIMNSIDCSNNVERISPIYMFDWKNIHYRFLMNPYAWYRIDLDIATNIITSTGRDPKNFFYEKKLGTISRLVYSKTIMNKQPKILGEMSIEIDPKSKGLIKNYTNWSGAPYWVIQQSFPDCLDHRNKLTTDYGLVFDELGNNDKLIYIKHVREEELNVYSFVKSNNNLQIGLSEQNHIDYDLEDMNPTDEQKRAIKGSLTKSLSIITGIAGSGKSTIIRLLVKNLRMRNINFRICGFTGKSVQRIRDILGDYAYEKISDKDRSKFNKDDLEIGYNSCNDELCIPVVKTIHSLIYSKSRDYKYIIVDEASMISLKLMSMLLKEFINKSVCFIFLGDINQLPPPEYGRPFEDIINSGCVKKYELTQNLRVHQNPNDKIIPNSTSITINDNYTPIIGDNFEIVNPVDKFQYISSIIMGNDYNINTSKFLAARNLDVHEINQYISLLINPKTDPIKSRRIRFYTDEGSGDNKQMREILINFSVGDPVMITKNNIYYGYKSQSEIPILNGMEGIITSFDVSNMETIMKVIIDKHNVDIPMIHTGNNIYKVDKVVMSYVITIHKSQGSEWNNIYLYIGGKESKSFYNKRLTYTGTTRAKQKFKCIEEKDGLYQSMCKTHVSIHYGGLIQRLRNDSSLNPQMIITTPTNKYSNSSYGMNINQKGFIADPQTGFIKLS